MKAGPLSLALFVSACSSGYAPPVATTGGATCPSCPANAICNSRGACECDRDYAECPEPDGGIFCAQEVPDDANCGGCGNICPTAESCLGSVCTCMLTTCVDAGESVCTDPTSDPLNCGTCGFICPEGEQCLEGACTCEASSTVAECPTDGGFVCIDLTRPEYDAGNPCEWTRQCLDSCPPDWATDGEFDCCDRACVDLFTDPFNCGACGNVCISGACVEGDAGTGVCDCPPPYEWCGSLCVDPISDYEHCGGCTACQPPAEFCSQGQCE